MCRRRGDPGSCQPTPPTSNSEGPGPSKGRHSPLAFSTHNELSSLHSGIKASAVSQSSRERGPLGLLEPAMGLGAGKVMPYPSSDQCILSATLARGSPAGLGMPPFPGSASTLHPSKSPTTSSPPLMTFPLLHCSMLCTMLARSFCPLVASAVYGNTLPSLCLLKFYLLQTSASWPQCSLSVS